MPSPILTPAPLAFTSSIRQIFVAGDQVAEGMTVFDDLIVWRQGSTVTAWDRICDHAGGRLVSTGSRQVVCPLHNWSFDPRTGRYDNGMATKRPLAMTPTGDGWTVALETRIPSLPDTGEALPVSVRFLNHACLLIEGAGVRFATDPWLFGSAFCDGWWLAQESPSDAVEALDSCDFLFISHNHPDHLHPETLACVRRDMPLVTADFASGSTERYLRDLGFEDVRPLGFGQAYRVDDSALTLAVLKSGDFRDDSGLYFRIGAFSALLTVDANFLNFGALPHATMLASSFAGGASGFPLCFDDYTADEKLRLLARNRGAVRAAVTASLETVRPRVFVPYAGFFTEDPVRDGDIARHNRKNPVAAYADLCERIGTVLTDVRETPVIGFLGDALSHRDAASVERREAQDRTAVLAASASRWNEISDAEIFTYFAESGFRGDFILNIAVTDDAFEPASDCFTIDFRGTTPVTARVAALEAPEVQSRTTGAQVTNARIRRPAFVRTLREGLPWEDLSIGFQARFTRSPNLYEADFWFHFTNVHIGSHARRASIDCGRSCLKLDARLV